MEMNTGKERLSPQRCTELLKNFEEKEILPMGEELRFSGVDGKDVYNITSPFNINFGTGPDKKTINVIAGRVETREASTDSHIIFFEENNGEWIPVKDAPTFPLEDGFITRIGDEMIFGGVLVYSKPTKDKPSEVGYKMVFYRGHNLSSLKENQFAIGPEGIKDIRLIALANGKIGVFTRPQDERDGRDKIGYVEIENLKELNDLQKISNARIIENLFAPDEWGGVNDLHILPDSRIGVVGHIAYQDKKDNKHYYAISFAYDPKTHSASTIKIIATIKNFPKNEAKTPVLDDIIFPGGLVRHDDGTTTLYAGLRDAKAGRLELPDPFKEKHYNRKI